MLQVGTSQFRSPFRIPNTTAYLHTFYFPDECDIQRSNTKLQLLPSQYFHIRNFAHVSASINNLWGRRVATSIRNWPIRQALSRDTENREVNHAKRAITNLISFVVEIMVRLKFCCRVVDCTHSHVVHGWGRPLAFSSSFLISISNWFATLLSSYFKKK